MADEYEYQPLPDEESIRVLVLSPGKGDESAAKARPTTRLAGQNRLSACMASEKSTLRGVSIAIYPGSPIEEP